MAAADLKFTEEDMLIDGAVGYPTAYAKICRDRGLGPYNRGPPFTFTPYALQPQAVARAKELDDMFPVMDPEAKPTAKAKMFKNLLWKQLDHLGNAGFDPAKFRVDPYGNVLYFHADAASPLAWDIDHWFPCSRGGLTVPSNLRILQWQVCKKKQWQVCKKKQNKLEFLIPWWDLQVGISVNQFLSIFASSNSDFRRRAFCLLFANGKNEELNDSQAVDSHSFPQQFEESKEKLGLAPAAVIASHTESFDASSTLKSLDINRRLRSNSPTIAAGRKWKTNSMSKENENPDITNNPYQAIVLARDSLRPRDETTKMQTEIQKLDDEVKELKQKTDEERVEIQDLELVLIKRRRRAEKCRRLAEAQSSYKAMLEKMIRDAMHQSVIYKEQLRLNQSASNALMARLEAQKAICDSSERELHKKFKHRDELEKQIKPEREQSRKRSRTNEALYGQRDEKTVLYLPGSKPIAHLEKETEGPLQEDKDEDNGVNISEINSRTLSHKELREFLEEEQKASESGLFLNGEESEQGREEVVEDTCKVKHEESDKSIRVMEEDEKTIIKDGLQKLRMRDGVSFFNNQFPDREPEGEEDVESRKQRGKGNVEKWLQMLLEGTEQDAQISERNTSKTDAVVKKLNLKYPQNEIKILNFPELSDTDGIEHASEDNVKYITQKKDAANEEEEIVEVKALEKYGGEKNKDTREIEARKIHLNDPPYRLSEKSNENETDCVEKAVGSSNSEKSGKVVVLKRSESARPYRRIPSSPSIILGMRKGMDCKGKKPLAIGDEEGDQNEASNNFLKSSIKIIKKVVKI